MERPSFLLRLLGAAFVVGSLALLANGCFLESGCESCDVMPTPLCAEGEVSTAEHPCLPRPPMSDAGADSRQPNFPRPG